LHQLLLIIWWSQAAAQAAVTPAVVVQVVSGQQTHFQLVVHSPSQLELVELV
jgi:hypothetical protein